MIVLYVFFILCGAYLFGSIPTAVWIGKKFYGIDVRDHGSGNAGATNTFRVLGWRAGVPVMLIDMLKGWTATMFVYFLKPFVPGSPGFLYMQIGLGIVAVIGHVYPVFADFRGGKGIATLFGTVLAIHAPAALICLGIFLITLIGTNYVSVGSMVAATAYPFIIYFVFKPRLHMVYFGILVCILVFYTHRKNITRLLAGNENKTFLFGRKKGLKEKQKAEES